MNSATLKTVALAVVLVLGTLPVTGCGSRRTFNTTTTATETGGSTTEETLVQQILDDTAGGLLEELLGVLQSILPLLGEPNEGGLVVDQVDPLLAKVDWRADTEPDGTYEAAISTLFQDTSGGGLLSIVTDLLDLLLNPLGLDELVGGLTGGNQTLSTIDQGFTNGALNVIYDTLGDVAGSEMTINLPTGPVTISWTPQDTSGLLGPIPTLVISATIAHPAGQVDAVITIDGTNMIAIDAIMQGGTLGNLEFLYDLTGGVLTPVLP